MKHLPRLTIHAVPTGSGATTAECGEPIGVSGNTGHYRPLRSFGMSGVHVCAVCKAGDR